MTRFDHGLLAAVAGFISDASSRVPLLVGIDGPGCAGKTTFADEVAQYLRPPVYVLGLDGFMLPLAEQHLWRANNEDLSSGIPHLRWGEIENLVLDLLPGGKPAAYRPYLWDSDQLGTAEHIANAQTVIVEGLYAFHPRILGAYGVRIWIDGQFDGRMSNAEQRMHGFSPPVRHKWLQLWRDLYVPRETDYIANWRPYHEADLFVLGRELNHTSDSFARRIGETAHAL
jgi:uridine kinase